MKTKPTKVPTTPTARETIMRAAIALFFLNETANYLAIAYEHRQHPWALSYALTIAAIDTLIFLEIMRQK